MKRVFGLIACLLLTTFIATGCTTSKGKLVLHNSPQLNPSEVVADYYYSLQQDNMSAAQQYLAPELIHYYRSTADGLVNLKRLYDIQVSDPTWVPAQGKDEVRVIATFVATYYHVRRSTNGLQTRVLYLGRSSNSQPWLIESISPGDIKTRPFK